MRLFQTGPKHFATPSKLHSTHIVGRRRLSVGPSSANNNSLSIFASELAALLKCNMFVSYEEALANTWKRNHAQTFELAIKRNQYVPPGVELQSRMGGTRLLERAKESKTVADVNRVEEETKQVVQVATLAEKALSSPRSVVIQAAEDHKDQDAMLLLEAANKVESMRAELRKVNEQLVNRLRERSLTAVETEQLKNVQAAQNATANVEKKIISGIQALAVEHVLSNASSTMTELSPVATEHTQNLKKMAAEQLMAAENALKAKTEFERTEWEAKRQEAKERYRAEQLNVQNFLERTAEKKLAEPVARELSKVAQTSYGKHAEKVFVEKEQVQQSNTRVYRIKAGEKVTVYGRIDGFKDGKLVEVKNRRARLFPAIPLYEEIQVRTYMEMLDLPEATIVQVFLGSSTSSVIKRHPFWWSNFVEPRLIEVEHEYAEIVHSQSKQDEVINALQRVDAEKSAKRKGKLNSTAMKMTSTL